MCMGYSPCKTSKKGDEDIVEDLVYGGSSVITQQVVDTAVDLVVLHCELELMKQTLARDSRGLIFDALHQRSLDSSSSSSHAPPHQPLPHRRNAHSHMRPRVTPIANTPAPLIADLKSSRVRAHQETPPIPPPKFRPKVSNQHSVGPSMLPNPPPPVVNRMELEMMHTNTCDTYSTHSSPYMPSFQDARSVYDQRPSGPQLESLFDSSPLSTMTPSPGDPCAINELWKPRPDDKPSSMERKSDSSDDLYNSGSNSASGPGSLEAPGFPLDGSPSTQLRGGQESSRYETRSPLPVSPKPVVQYGVRRYPLRPVLEKDHSYENVNEYEKEYGVGSYSLDAAGGNYARVYENDTALTSTSHDSLMKGYANCDYRSPSERPVQRDRASYPGTQGSHIAPPPPPKPGAPQQQQWGGEQALYHPVTLARTRDPHQRQLGEQSQYLPARTGQGADSQQQQQQGVGRRFPNEVRPRMQHKEQIAFPFVMPDVSAGQTYGVIHSQEVQPQEQKVGTKLKDQPNLFKGPQPLARKSPSTVPMPDGWTCANCTNIEFDMSLDKCEVCDSVREPIGKSRLDKSSASDNLDKTSGSTRRSETELEQVSKQLDCANSKVSELKGAIENLSKQLEITTNSEQVLSKQLKTANQELIEMEASIQNISEQFASASQELMEVKDSNQQLTHTDLEQTKAIQLLSQQLESANTELAKFHTERSSIDIEPWKVACSKVEKGAEIARGGWGTISKGKVSVAIKELHGAIAHQIYIDQFRREMQILSQVRHPNLVQFIGAVFDQPSGASRAIPLIIIELLDTNLRSAYEEGQLRADHKLPIFKDVAKALKYLHERYDPIIHRDVSAPNVLLEALPGGKWKGKLSDLGSANYLKHARTHAPGAILYAAPETFPNHNPNAHRAPQTFKIDVFSFGIMLIEVMTSQLPTEEDKQTCFNRCSALACQSTTSSVSALNTSKRIVLEWQ